MMNETPMLAGKLAIFRINYKSDFILTLESDAGWGTPFCIKFWTGAPSQAYYAGWDGTTYTNCAPVEGDPSKLQVQFDNHHLPIGELKYQVGYHFTVADFPTTVEDEVINQDTVVIVNNGRDEKVLLDFNGETAPDIQFALPAYVNEAQRIANEQQRIANEQTRIANEQQRIQNEEQRIAQETARVEEFASLKRETESAAQDANDAATLANAKAQLAADKAALAQAAATLANDKAALAQQKAEYAQTQGDYAKAQGDTALADHQTAVADHQTAAADHQTAAADHTQAGNDHTRAESDHTRAESDHAAVELFVDSLGAFDISAYHATGGVLTKYANLTAALDSNNGGGVPQSLQKGGMSVKFVCSSDNKYVQYRYMGTATTGTPNPFLDTANWQGVDDVPTAGSDNLVKSGGVAEKYGEYEDNSEFIQVVTDSKRKLLYGVKVDGEFVFGVGVPKDIKDYILAQKALVDADVLAEKVRAMAAEATKVDKVVGKGLSSNDFTNEEKDVVNINSLTISEGYAQAIIDSNNKVLEGIKADGTKEVNVDVELNGDVLASNICFHSDEEKEAFVEYLDVQPVQRVSQIVVDLPVSDGTDIESGYAYIDSTDRCVKVKA